MELDQLKNAWREDQPAHGPLPVSAAMRAKTSSAVEKVRKNMRNELLLAVGGYLVIAVALLVMKQPDTVVRIIAGILLPTMFLLNCFYFFRFYLFYKRISRYDFSMKESIRKMAYELELNMEIYKTYNLCIAPLAVLSGITLVEGAFVSSFIQKMVTPEYITVTVTILLISFAATFAGLEWHVNHLYGRYLRELKQAMEDLEKEG
jgi:hypothetical protein